MLTPDFCPKCGLSKRATGSVTSWIFNAQQCLCVTEVEDDEPRDSEQSSENPPENVLNERYAIKNFVGQGGLSNVYKAEDLTTNKLVAIKILRPEFGQEQAAINRLLKEAEIATRLVHRNLITVWGYGQDRSGLPYIVMDFIFGDNLETFLKDGTQKLNQQETLRVFMQICQGLKCAHAHGIIHRDLKPSNIIIELLPSGVATAKIIDFGFSKLTRSSDADARLTQTGEAFGSPAYMSPEHCLGQEVDERSDIYSFGCVMYEMLTGRAPLSGKNVLATIANQVSMEPELPKNYNTEISDSMQNVVMRCLAKEPVLRYQSVSDLLDDLLLVKSGSKVEIAKGAKKIGRVFNKTARVTYDKRNWLMAFNLGVVVMFVCNIVGIGYFWYKNQNKDAVSTQTVAPPDATQASVAEPVSAAPVATKNPVTKSPAKIAKNKVVKVKSPIAKMTQPKGNGWDELRNLRDNK